MEIMRNWKFWENNFKRSKVLECYSRTTETTGRNLVARAEPVFYGQLVCKNFLPCKWGGGGATHNIKLSGEMAAQRSDSK